jgi:hypothetical protein
MAPVQSKILKDADHPRGQVAGSLSKDIGKSLTQPMQALAHGDAMLEEEASYLIDNRSPLTD